MAILKIRWEKGIKFRSFFGNKFFGILMTLEKHEDTFFKLSLYFSLYKILIMFVWD